MKTSFTAFAVLAAVVAAAPAFAQGNSYFDNAQFQPSRAEQQQIARQEQRDSRRAYALTGQDARRADEKVSERAVQVPGNGYTPVLMPTDR